MELDGTGILGLAAGDLIDRSLGSGEGQLRWIGEGGFAAFGAERAVKFTDSTLNWSEPFFIGGARALILSHDTADATLDWQQGISMAGSTRIIQVDDGAAAIDAKMSGLVTGGLDDNSSNFFRKTGAGTLALTHQNSYRGDTIISLGTLMVGDGGTSGGLSRHCRSIQIESGGVLAINRSDTILQGSDPFIAPMTGEGSFAQIGSGTTILSLANDYAGTTDIQAGTLALGQADVLPDTSPVILGNATLDLASFDENAGPLSIHGTAKLILAEGGSIAFADSRHTDWNGGELTLEGDFETGTSIRFGSTNAALSTSQLAAIRADGFASFTLDTDGFLIGVPGGGYESWALTQADGQTADLDADGDGVANGIEYLLGGSASTHDAGKLPTLVQGPTGLSFSFIRDQASIGGSTQVIIEAGDDLIHWPTTYVVPETAIQAAPGITVTKDQPQSGSGYRHSDDPVGWKSESLSSAQGCSLIVSRG